MKELFILWLKGWKGFFMILVYSVLLHIITLGISSVIGYKISNYEFKLVEKS